tara:strand:- start:4134 stop:4340 length:207 start_codon:yes stop_codon:yes gene_type:complete
LGWSQNELALAAGLGVSTVKRMEASASLVQGNGVNIWRLQEVLIAAGVEFIAPDANTGPGVRLMQTPS